MPTGCQFGFDVYRLDLANEQLWCGAQVLPLTAKALRVLGTLVAHAGQLVSKDTLFQTVWPEAAVSEGVLSNCIGELRKALGETAQAPRFIQTVHRRGYRFLAPVTVLAPPAAALAASALPGAPTAPAPALPPLLVGRDAEVAALRQRLAQALGGQRQVVLVSGEAGLGKTSVVDAFLATLAPTVPVWVAWGQCLAHYGAGEAYLPVLDALGRLGRAPGHARLLALLGQYAPTWVGQLPALFTAADLEAGQRPGLGATRERMLREAAECLEAVSAEQPLVLVLEDLHWSDHATLDLLTWLARRREPARLLVLGTYRPVEVIVQGHPLQAVKQELLLHGQCVELRLEGLSAAAVTAYLTARLPGHALPPAVVAALHRRTDGHPLFLVQLVDALQRQGALVEEGGRWTLPGGLAVLEATVPESLRQLIAQQFDGLSAEQQRALEAASVAGLAWPVAAVAAGVEADEGQVEGWCAGLARQGQFVRVGELVAWPDGTVGGSYQFRHALYQQVVYERVPVGQRVRLHQRIGLRVEVGYGARAHEVAAELAVHFERGHDPARAVRYRQQAAAQALGRYAYQEALSHLTRGLELLQRLPDTPERAQHELALQLARGQALMTTMGFAAPAVEAAYTRALELCRRLGQTAQRFPGLYGLWRIAVNRVEFQTAQELSQQLLDLAQHQQDPSLLLEAYRALGQTLFWRGELVAAQTALTQGLALYNPQHHRTNAVLYGRDSRVDCHCYAAWLLWLRGYPERAVQGLEAGRLLARELTDPYGLAHALLWEAILSQFRRAAHAAQAWAEAAMALCTEQGYTQWLAGSTIVRGWSLVMQGQGEEGLGQIHQGLAAHQASGSQVALPYFLALLAEASGQVGQVGEGLQVLASLLTTVQQRGGYWWQAELYRLQGELLLAQAGQGQRSTGPSRADAESGLQQALAIARRQQAKSMELRAALSLARLWQRQGQHAAAYELLAPVYHWFTEGFDTADLQEAKALLAALRS
jgi:DNA-binding winged helix-turn-helix (wHTH) protein/predicted ATPase